MIKKYILVIIASLMFCGVLNASKINYLSIGKSDAKITIKVFSSLTCPHCANFHNKIYYNLKKEYIDEKKVKFEHHSFPLDLAALNAEKILRCTENIDTSFNLLTEIYLKQEEWAVGSDIKKINESIIKIGTKFNLSKKAMNKCLENEKIQEQILTERIDAQKKYKISSTPTIYINEKKYEGKHEFKNFKKQIDKLL